MAKRLPIMIALAVLAGAHPFLLAQDARAETTAEMIDRLARQGRSKSWVQAGDCRKEQAAVDPGRAAGSDGALDENSPVGQALFHPWVYRYSGERKGEEMSADELLRRSQKYEQAAAEGDRKAARYREMQRSPDPAVRLGSVGYVPETAEAEARMNRLYACAYAVAAQRKSGVGTAPAATAAATQTGTATAATSKRPTAECAADAAVNANRELLQIDERVGKFNRAQTGPQAFTSTPALQVIMWGTQEQARIMGQYCPDSPAFQQRIDNYMSVFRLAQEACRKVQSRPELCVPVAPQ